MSHGEPVGDLIESIYTAALRPAAWPRVMPLLRLHFRSTMEAFYFLDFGTRETRVVALSGVTPGWVSRFSALYFTPDNPWARLTRQLHQPGSVRTTETLIRHTRDPGILRRSVYFNEWMRPQYFQHTLGATPYAGGSVIANVSLFRPADAPRFGTNDIARMHRLGGHLARAIEVGMRLEHAAHAHSLGLQAFDVSAEGVALVDSQARLQYANPALERRLRAAEGLFVRDGRLQAAPSAADERLRQSIGRAAAGVAAPAEAWRLEIDAVRSLVLRAMPIRSGSLLYRPEQPVVLVLVTGVPTHPLPGARELQRRHGLTPAQSRLAAALASGMALREAAQRCGISYGTSRIYLKQLFARTGVHRQAELVSRLLSGHSADV